jgi:hypothetical protein
MRSLHNHDVAEEAMKNTPIHRTVRTFAGSASEWARSIPTPTTCIVDTVHVGGWDWAEGAGGEAAREGHWFRSQFYFVLLFFSLVGFWVGACIFFAGHAFRPPSETTAWGGKGENLNWRKPEFWGRVWPLWRKPELALYAPAPHSAGVTARPCDTHG